MTDVLNNTDVAGRPVGFLGLSVNGSEGDYDFCPHIITAGKGKVILVIQRLKGSPGAAWEPVPVEYFGIAPVAQLIRRYDPEKVARHPVDDDEHRKLLSEYRFI